MILPPIPEKEAERLAALARYEILDTATDSAFDDITLIAAQVCQTPICLISLVAEHRQWFKSCQGLEVKETAREISFCAHAIAGQALFEVSDASQDPRFAENPLVIGQPNIRFYAGMPLVTEDGHSIGTLCVIDQQPHVLNDAQKTVLAALSRQVMRLLEQGMQKKYRELQLETRYAQMEAAIEAIPDLIWVKDLDGVFVKCNRAFAIYMGRSKQDIIGKTEYDFFDKEAATFYLENDKMVIQTLLPRRMEAWLTFEDGYRGLFEAVKTAVVDNAGQCIGTLSMAHDITQRKRQEAKIRRKQEAMQTLNEIASKIFHDDFSEQLRAVLALGSAYLGLETGIIASYSHDELEMKIAISTKDWIGDTERLPLRSSATFHLLRGTHEFEVVTLLNIANDRPEVLQWVDAQEQSSFIGVMILINGEVYGALAYYSAIPRQHPFDPSEIEFMKLLAAWISCAVQRENLDSALRNSNERIELALEGADLGLWDWHIPSNRMTFNSRWHEMLGLDPNHITPSIEVFHHLLHPDDQHEVLSTIEAQVNGELSSLDIEFRMRHHRGHWVWIDNHARVIERNPKGAPVRIIGTFMDITQRKATEEEIKHLAFYDALTGLPNRRLLLDRLGHAMTTSVRSQSHGALLFIDLDNFKNINDTHGHDEGDKLLMEVARRLCACVRASDTVARLGGDEFVIMLEGLNEDVDEAFNQIQAVGDKVLASLNIPYLLGNNAFHNTPSIGVTLFNGHQDSQEELLKRADMAMYQAKAAGRNCLRFFNPSMQAAISAFAALEADLRYSIENNQLMLYYQPQIDIAGKLTGAEALVRWKHPERGMVSPADFIPVAEQTGLILPIGEWVLEAGCKQLVEWSKSPATNELVLSINVSARQFRQAGFVTQVRQIIQYTGANPYQLKLELTESMLVEDVEDVINKMSALQAIGVGFSLDDFGTGFSSLSYLKRLPLNQLKIDQSFVRDVLTDPNDAVIVRTIVALAKSLGFKVIAEGVETQAQRDFLADNGCGEYQGYFFSRPLASEDFEQFSLRIFEPNHAKLSLVKHQVLRA